MAKTNFDAKKTKENANAPKPLNVKEAVPAEDQSQFKRDMAKFYDVNPATTKEADLEKIPLSTGGLSQSMASLPPRVKTASDAAGSGRPPKPNSQVANSSSKIFKANADRFYGGTGKMSGTHSSQGSLF